MARHLTEVDRSPFRERVTKVGQASAIVFFPLLALITMGLSGWACFYFVVAIPKANLIQILGLTVGIFACAVIFTMATIYYDEMLTALKMGSTVEGDHDDVQEDEPEDSEDQEISTTKE